LPIGAGWEEKGIKKEESRPRRRKDELALKATMKTVAQKRRRVSSRLVGGELQSFMVSVHRIWKKRIVRPTWEEGADRGALERVSCFQGTSDKRAKIAVVVQPQPAALQLIH